jgi:hypothetical protein
MCQIRFGKLKEKTWSRQNIVLDLTLVHKAQKL